MKTRLAIGLVIFDLRIGSSLIRLILVSVAYYVQLELINVIYRETVTLQTVIVGRSIKKKV